MNTDELDPRTNRVLDERAKRLANDADAATPRRIVGQVAVLLVGKTHIGIDVHSLREVLHIVPVTPLPGLPEGMLGVAQVRGEVLSVVDLSRWIGTEDRGAGACLAVVEGPRGALGLIVDHCTGFRDLYDDDIIAEPSTRQTARLRYVHQVTRDVCAILDVAELLDDPRLIVGGRRAPKTEAES